MNRNALAGVLFIAVGATAAAVAWTYPLGTAARPGPGVLPLAAAALLVGIGVAVVVRAARACGWLPRRPLRMRPLLAVLASLVAFALVLPRLGFVAASAVLVLLAGSGLSGVRVGRLALLAALGALSSYVLFVRLLGVQAPAWPGR
jgi:hypothetical protein